jgi:hypothetical protein
MEVFFLILACALVALGIYMSVIKKKRIKKQEEIFNSLSTIVPGFKAEKYFKNNAGLSMIAIDQNLRKIFMAAAKSRNSTEIIYRAVNYEDLVKVEIIEDGHMVGSKSFGSTLLGDAVGGAAGSVIGSNTTFKKVVKNIFLNVVVDDVMSPSFQLIFFNKSLNKFSVAKARKECQEWVDTLFVVMKRRSTAPTANDTKTTLTGY